MRTKATIITKNGINWYYEQEGSGPHIVLIPDGIGDCGMFSKPMSLIAKQGFTVTTFDMPGMSRSSNAPKDTYNNITAQKLATYVISIIDELHIDIATFWGSSSGGATVLALAADHPQRVRNCLPHEVPYKLIEHLSALSRLPDETISKLMADSMATSLVGDTEAWEALGQEFHARLWKNYVRWARGYPLTLPQSSPAVREELTRRPLDWTVGAGTPTGTFYHNIVTATKFGINFTVTPGMHFPYVSHPEEFATYVVETTMKYL